MVGDALQRRDKSSPPVSPRTASSDEYSEAVEAQGTLDKRYSTGNTVPLPGASAPRWRSSSYPDRIKNAPPISSSGPAPGSSGTPVGNISLPLHTNPLTLSRLPLSHADSLPEFTFTGCDIGQDGQLIAASRLPSTASVSGHGSSSTMFIKPEVSLKAQVQKEAATAYHIVLSKRAGAGSANPGSGATTASRSAASFLETAQQRLESDVMILELALDLAKANELPDLLNNVVSKLAAYRSVLASQAASEVDTSASENSAPARKTLADSLDALETACTSGWACWPTKRRIWMALPHPRPHLRNWALSSRQPTWSY